MRGNISHLRGFTLVELLVVMVIIAILSTLAFVSFTRYTSQARDATRGSDIKNITTVLNLNKVRNAKFPDPTNPIDITYSGATVWTQGVFGKDSARQTGKIFGELRDPLYKNHYTYSVTNNRKEYQLGVYYENTSFGTNLTSFHIDNPLSISEAYAADPFSPLELTPKIWLDGEDIDGDGQTNDNPSDGGTITTWVNKSSAGATNNPSITHGSIQFSDDGLDGNFPGVFISNGDGLRLDNSDISAGDIFYVVQNNDPFGNTDGNGRALQGTSENMLIGYWEKYRHSLYIDGAPSHYNSSPATKSGRTSYSFIYGFHSDGTNYDFRDVGSIISQGATNSISGQEWGFNKAGYSNQRADFVVSEILIFDTKLSSQEREKVEGYLAHKWGQEQWLLGSHPYKSDPPEGSGPPPVSDTTPNIFVFNDVTDADISTQYTSNSVTVSGINQFAAISVTGGEYSVNGGAFTGASGSVVHDDVIVVRQTSSGSNSTTTTVMLNIGGITEGYDITTFVADTTPDNFSFNAISDADVDTLYPSNSITVSGLNTSVGISISGGDAEYKIASGLPSDATGDGSASASSTYSSNSPSEAFDNNTSANGWGNNGSLPAWLKYDFGSGGDKQVQKYTLYRNSSQSGGWGNNAWSPKSWTFEGSDDNVNWDTLDTQTNQIISNNATKKTFSLTNTVYYRYYRINISSAYDSSSWVNITEMEMIDGDGGVFTSSPGTIQNGDIISLRMTSSVNAGTTETSTLTVGTVGKDFVISTIAPDTTPDTFSFVDVSDAALNTEYTSNSVTITGINTAVAISLSGVGEYKINSGIYTSIPGTINDGDVVALKQTSSASNSQTVSSTLDIGGMTATYNVTTPAPPPDTTPDIFSFVDITGADFDTQYSSNSITVSGVNTSISISVTGGEYDINGSKSFTAASSTVNNGDVISVRRNSSANPSTTVDVTLSLGGVSDTYSITTETSDTTPDTYALSDITGAIINTSYSSNSVDVSGINQAASISITGGGEYSINGASFTSSSGIVNNGDSVVVRRNSSSNWNTIATTMLSIGGVNENFQINTGAGDTTPDGFAFSSETDASLYTQYTSNTITVTGLTAPANISISDGEYRVGATGSFTINSGTIQNNQELTVRQVSSIVGSTKQDAVVNIGGVSGIYSVTTQDFTPVVDTTPTAPISNVRVVGEYNGLIVHAQDADTHFILATPSIIASDTSNTDLVHLLQEKKLVYNGFNNIPASYSGNNIDVEQGFDFALRDPLLYSGTREDIGSYSGLKEIDEGVKSNYANFPVYSDVASYLDDFSLGYLERIIGSIIGINPIKPFYCSDILRSKLVTNIAPLATITASPSAYNSYGISGIANGNTSTQGDLDYEYHSASANATIEFEWDTPQAIGFVKIYNRTGCCSERLTGAVIKLYNNFGGLIYSHPLWDTTGDYVIGLDLEGIGHLHDVKRMTLESVGGNFLNLREVEIYLGGNIRDGVYKVDKDGLGGQSPYNVYCDMTTDGGGWTRIGENYIHNGNFAGQFHIDEHTFSGYNNINDNLIVAHSLMAPPSYIPESFVMKHNGTASEAYPLYFPDIPGAFFAQEIRLRAWVKGTTGSVFQHTINYETSSTVSNQAEYEVLETAENGWEYQLVRIPLEGGLVEDFTWDVGKGVTGPFYFTDLDMEVYYR